MRIKFLKGVCIGVGINAEPGQIHDVKNSLALVLIHQRRAILVSEDDEEIKIETETPLQKRGKNERR